MRPLFDELLGFIIILNPFALSLYLTGVMDDLESREFLRVMCWASFLSFGVFLVFAVIGDYIVVRLFGVGPDALRIFGGIVIGIIAYGYVTRGYRSLEVLRGSLDDLPSAIAVPFMVGAGSLTKSILIGRQHPFVQSTVVLIAGVLLSLAVVLVFKSLREHMRKAYEKVFDRYVNMLARINGLLLGAVAVDMIVAGARSLWLT